MDDSFWTRRGDAALAALLGAGAFLLYLSTLAPTVLGGDAGEFQFVPYLLGVAHPTGYPLYCLLGWAWSHGLPFGDPALRMNLFSAFWAALAVGLLYPTALMVQRRVLPALSPVIRRLLAALTAATFAVTPTFWSQAVVAEVYTLHVFFVVLIFYLLFKWSRNQQAASNRSASRTLLLAACCFGLSLAHHSTTLLLAPAILAYVLVTHYKLRVAREKPQLATRNWQFATPALLLTACCLPLALYLYIPLRAPHTPYLHLSLTEGRELVLYENTLANWLDFVTGGPFGGSVDLGVDLGARLAMAWGFFLNELSWIGVLLALLGVAWLVARQRWASLILMGLAFVAVVAFNLVYTIGDIYVLYIPAHLIAVLWLGVGTGLLARTAQRLLGQRRWLAVGVVALFFLLPVWQGIRHYDALDHSHRTSARTRWEAILAEPALVSSVEPLPADAILISNDRNNVMPMWYFQYVAGRRPDLLGLFPLVTPEYPTLGHVLDLALSTGRPIYLVKAMPGVEVKVEIEAKVEVPGAGELWQVGGPAARGEPAHPVAARLADAVALVGYDVAPGSHQPGEALRASLYWETLRPLETKYHTFVQLLDANGDKVAQSDRQPGGVYYSTTLWRPGERLRDDHVLALPADVSPGTYRLLVGMYALAEDGTLTPLGEAVVVGEVEIE